MKTVVFCGVLLVGWFCLIFFSVFLLILQCKSQISHLLLWGISKVTFHYTREEKVADQSPSLPNVVCQRKRPESHCPKGMSPMTRVSPTGPGSQSSHRLPPVPQGELSPHHIGLWEIFNNQVIAPSLPLQAPEEGIQNSDKNGVFRDPGPRTAFFQFCLKESIPTKTTSQHLQPPQLSFVAFNAPSSSSLTTCWSLIGP